MIDKATKKLFESLARLTRFNAKVVEKSAGVYAEGAAQTSRLVGFQSYLVERWVDGGLSPLMKSLWAMERDIADPLLDCLLGERELSDYVQELGQRATSGARYRKLVHTLGRELFGSARFDSEEVIAESELLTLSHIPPPPGAPAQQTALFHVGGFIPYGDRVFRFLPEANLFLPFLRRGLPVYAMEVKPGLPRGRLEQVTLEELIDAIASMSARAFEHHGRGKLLLEGYCGVGLPMLSFIAARPEEADARFAVAMLMAAPVDARACTLLGEMLESVPNAMLSPRLTLSSIFGRYLHGEPLRLAIDIPISTFFYKTRTGQFLTGWKRREYAEVERIEELTAEQRMELAGAYWISPRTFSNNPIPPDMLRLFTGLWQRGLDADLTLPCRYRGEQLSLRRIVDRTRIQLVGFYGGEDRLIPQETAALLQRHLGPRYRHVVHAGAGHVSYIVVPALWDTRLPYAFKPNPIDLALELFQA